MDDFNYLQDDALTKWFDLYGDTTEDANSAVNITFIENEFLPRFERDIYLNAASKMMTAGKRATDSLGTE